MDVSIDQLAESQKRKYGHGNETETLREKLTLFKWQQKNKVMSTKYLKSKIDNKQQNNKCWLCGDKDKTITW